MAKNGSSNNTSPPDTPKPKKKLGPPFRAHLRLTPKLQEELCNLLLDGNYVETACAVVGLPKKSFYAFMRQGRDAAEACEKEGRRPTAQERKFIKFNEAVRSAMAEAEARDIRNLRMAGAHDWRALAWRLERRHPKRWGQRADITSDGKALQGGGLTLAALREFLADDDGEGDDDEANTPQPQEEGEA